jgi:hypothetical protein
MARLKRHVLIGLMATLGVALGIGALLLIQDVHEDRQFSVKVIGPVNVYESGKPSQYGRGAGTVIEVLRPPSEVQVLRRTFGTNYEAVRVKLPDGREGYIFCCENFQLTR